MNAPARTLLTDPRLCTLEFVHRYDPSGKWSMRVLVRSFPVGSDTWGVVRSDGSALTEEGLWRSPDDFGCSQPDTFASLEEMYPVLDKALLRNVESGGEAAPVPKNLCECNHILERHSEEGNGVCRCGCSGFRRKT